MFRRPNPVFSDEYAAIRNAIVQARRGAGVSQRQLAARLGKSQSHVVMIERGQRRIDALELMKMASALSPEPLRLLNQIWAAVKDLERAG